MAKAPFQAVFAVRVMGGKPDSILGTFNIEGYGNRPSVIVTKETVP